MDLMLLCILCKCDVPERPRARAVSAMLSRGDYCERERNQEGLEGGKECQEVAGPAWYVQSLY